MYATEMQLKVLFEKKLHGRPDFKKKKQQQRRVFFDIIFYVYTHEWLKTKETNFVGRKTWKFKAAGRQWEMLACSKVKMRGSEKKKASMNTGDEIFAKHIRQFLQKNN